MSFRVRALVLACCATLGADLVLGPSAPPAEADTVTVTKIVGITAAVGDSSLVGGQLTTMTVRVRLVDPDGVSPTICGMADWNLGPGPCLGLIPTNQKGEFATVTTQARGLRVVLLRLAQGTTTDGVWQGTTLMGAADAGFWRPAMIAAGDLSQPASSFMNTFVTVPEPFRSRVVATIRGYDWPIVSISLPAPTPDGTPFTIRGRVVTSRTGRPLAGERVVLTPEERPPFGYPAWSHAVRTGPTGWWAYTTTLAVGRWYASFGVDAARNEVQGKSAAGPNVRQTVSATPSSSVVPRRRAIVITGKLGTATTLPVTLLRQVGTQWRTVTTAATSNTGAYRVRLVPARGTWRYRVRTAASESLLAGVSRTLRITGR